MNGKKEQKAQLMRNFAFRWYLSGGMVSMMGDQFTIIALPWLVLKITGDTLALGIVAALVGIPRALLMLLGGAIVDRYSPKSVLMITKYINTVLLGIIAAMAFSGNLHLPLVYLIALAIGLATAFSIPAGSSMLPHIVKREQLQTANSLLIAGRQLTMFIGPLCAGMVIALFSSGNSASAQGGADWNGIGVAFLIDALTFVLSAWTLVRVQVHGEIEQPSGGLLKSLFAGIAYCWNEKTLRMCFLYWAAIVFFIGGPIQIALPVFANQLSSNAIAYGVLAGAQGAGALFGMLLAGARPGLRIGTIGTTILILDFAIGGLLIPLGQIKAIWQGAVMLLFIGALAGFLQINIFTWIQRRVPPVLIGRITSMLMFIFVGISPLSAALAGWLMRTVAPSHLFIICGGLLIAVVIFTAVTSGMRRVSDAPMAARTE